MAVLHDIYINKSIAAELDTVEVDAIKSVIAKYFWKWFDLHMEDKLLTVKILIINKTIRVKDVKPLFAMLFGPEGTI